MPTAVPQEVESIHVFDENGKQQTIRLFQFSLSNGIVVELSSLGASITKIILPSSAGSNDVVLGFNSPADMWNTGNPVYLGAIVGRVANRIRNGRLILNKNEDGIQLDINSPPNHLHGGIKGFNRCIWEAEVISKHHDGSQSTDSTCEAVRFSLLSPHNDQHYPGAVAVTATYTLHPTVTGVKLCLHMEAELQDGSQPTPINLAQHSYFNLSRHDDPKGVLDHQLMLNSSFYTPFDNTGIPTRDIVALSDDDAMDWREPRLICDGLGLFGRDKAMLSHSNAKEALSKSGVGPDIAIAGPKSVSPGEPYGFDHDYIVNQHTRGNMATVGVLEHEGTKRRLTVRSDAPGVQLYTANHLDGVSLKPEVLKDKATYRQWQGICLETQSFPDSIDVDPAMHSEFAQGRCTILTPQCPYYSQKVEYEFQTDTSTQNHNDPMPSSYIFRGSDSNDRSYNSIDEMWLAMGVTKDSSGDWYFRAANYYEENCDATIDGVLGGFAAITEVDLKGSCEFIQSLDQLSSSSFSWASGAACECGAGIGRVSKGLLLPLGVPRCDLVESSARLISVAPDYIGEEASKCRFYCSGLQDWVPVASTYSIIWIQWVLCYLTDYDAVRFLKDCGSALVNEGYICVKENTCTDEDFVVDLQDASVTRSVSYLKFLADQAGLQLVLETLQTTFPSDIYPVPMLAFKQKQR
jgi:galactose mutarotase-like enzyme